MYFLYKNEYGMFKPAEFTVKRGLKQQGEKWRGKPIWGICIHTHTEKCHNETPCTTITNKNAFKKNEGMKDRKVKQASPVWELVPVGGRT
jgi:hypothetical protein